MKKIITITYKIQSNNIREVMDTLVKVYTEIWDSNEYLKYTIASTQFSIRGTSGNYTFTSNITYCKSKEQMNYVKTQTKSIIHYYSTRNRWTWKSKSSSWLCSEALANRSAVCQGYTLFTFHLLKKAGVESHIVVRTENGGPHAWTLVKILEKWYHIDTTFDDPIPDVKGRVTYSDFNMSNEQIKKSWMEPEWIPKNNNILKWIEI